MYCYLHNSIFDYLLSVKKFRLRTLFKCFPLQCVRIHSRVLLERSEVEVSERKTF